MQINIYKDPMQKAYLFGAPVLYSDNPIPRKDVPQGWHCYDLRGTTQDPDRPYSLVDQTEKNHAGSILSYLPLKSGRSQSRLIKDMFQLTCVSVSLKKFCTDEKIQCPETPLRHTLRPASPEEAGFFYALPPEQDEELGTIGHVRIDFGRGACCQNYGFTLETERYLYRLRCNPIEGDHQAYLTCFDKKAQKMDYGLTEKGRQALQDAADPGKAHSYSWYVIENINTPELRVDHDLSLEAAIQLYAFLDCEDKRLGVTKDGIAAVDLAIRWKGREWLSEDRLKLDSFKDDPVVTDAAAHLQQMLEAAPAMEGMSL